jgi:cell division topological specificity factor
MSSFFDRVLGREKKSANQAKERLKLVLIHDRTDLSPGALEMLKDDLIAVISRYVQIDSSAVQIGVEQAATYCGYSFTALWTKEKGIKAIRRVANHWKIYV